MGATDSGGTVDATVATGAVSGGPNAFAEAPSGLLTPLSTTPCLTGLSMSELAVLLSRRFVGDVNSGTSFSNDGWDMTTSNIKDPSKGAGNIAWYPGITGFN